MAASSNTAVSALSAWVRGLDSLTGQAVPATPRRASVFGGGIPSGPGSAFNNKILAKQGKKDAYLLQMQGLTAAKDGLLSLAKANVLKQKQELDMVLQDAAIEFSSVTSAQRAAAGASGISVNSGSFLDVFADQAARFSTQMQRAKDVSRLNQESLMREALYQAESYKYDLQAVTQQQKLDELMIER